MNIDITTVLLGVIALVVVVYLVSNVLFFKMSKKAMYVLLAAAIILIPIFGKLYITVTDRMAIKTTIEETVKSTQVYSNDNGFQKIVFITDDGNCWVSFDESMKDLDAGTVVTIVYDDARHKPSTSKGVEPVELTIKTA